MRSAGTVLSALDGPMRRERIAVLAGSAALMLVSVIWGLSGAAGGGTGNPLGASVEVSSASSGVFLVTVANRSRRTWEDVRVVVDDRYVHRVPEVIAGGRVDVPMSDFVDRMALPRATGLYLWEERIGSGAVRSPGAVTPSRVRVEVAGRGWETAVRP